MDRWARIENGHVVELVDFDPGGRFHADLLFVPVPDGVPVQIGDRWDGERFIAPSPPTLDQLKGQKKAGLAARRWAVQTGGIVVNGVPIQTDQASQGNLSDGVLGLQLAPAGQAVPWKFSDGVFRDVDLPLAQSLLLAVLGHIQACYAREKALAEAIDAAVTQEALDAIDINAGWPSNG